MLDLQAMQQRNKIRPLWTKGPHTPSAVTGAARKERPVDCRRSCRAAPLRSARLRVEAREPDIALQRSRSSDFHSRWRNASGSCPVGCHQAPLPHRYRGASKLSALQRALVPGAGRDAVRSYETAP